MDRATTSISCIAEVSGSNLDGDTGCAEVYRGFHRSIQTNTGTLLHIKSGRFLSHPFQFIILV
jgi:hypothetical protein